MKYIIATILILTLSSCATKNGGFFNSYEGMQKVDENLYFAKADDANLTRYNKIYIPEVMLMINSSEMTPAEHKLNVEIKAYATTAYRKMISKNSSNYELVGIGQKDTIVMQIALSLARLNPDKKGLDAVEFLPFSSNETKDKLHLVIEVETIDVMNSKPLARSVRIIKSEEIDVHALSFKEVQASLDAWLATVIKH